MYLGNKGVKSVLKTGAREQRLVIKLMFQFDSEKSACLYSYFSFMLYSSYSYTVFMAIGVI